MPLEAELDGLAGEVLAVLRDHPEAFGDSRQARRERWMPTARLPGFVLESESGLTLGESPARSLSLALPVFELALDEDAVWTLGPAFVESREPRDFLQILLVKAPPPASRVLLSRLASLRSLSRRVPGWFAHSEGTRTSVRVHRQLLAEGLSQDRLARALLDQLRDEGFHGPAAVAVGVPAARALELLQPLAERLERLKGSLIAARTEAGVREGCEGKDCRTCDEKVVCDKVREVLAEDRRAKGTR